MCVCVCMAIQRFLHNAYQLLLLLNPQSSLCILDTECMRYTFEKTGHWIAVSGKFWGKRCGQCFGEVEIPREPIWQAGLWRFCIFCKKGEGGLNPSAFSFNLYFLLDISGKWFYLFKRFFFHKKKKVNCKHSATVPGAPCCSAPPISECSGGSC